MTVKKEYYDNNNISSEVFIINDKMEGEYKSYYINGNLHFISNYVNGIKHGTEIKYHFSEDINGKIYKTCNYKDGELHGKLIRYYKNGIINTIEYYEDGYKEGECKYYNEKGLLDEVINYINDSMDGYYYKYNDGVLETKCEYFKDEYTGESLVGDYINYYPNGSIKYICCYDDGQKNGEYIEYYESIDDKNGKIKAKGNYESNYKIGYEYRYDIDGCLIEKVFVDEHESQDEETYNEHGDDN